MRTKWKIKKSGPLPDLLPSDINFNDQWDDVDHDFLSSDEVEEGENDPKVYFIEVLLFNPLVSIIEI